jgi:exodeoxyribonuclease V alpha subunit
MLAERGWLPQEQAVPLALTAKVAVLAGGRGCGRSFTVKSVITLAAAKRSDDRRTLPGPRRRGAADPSSRSAPLA